MRASTVLKRYTEGERDFRGLSLRGQSFKGQDLSGADFSKCDIHSTNFTGANLREAKFCQALAGLQRRWAILLVVASWLLALISGFFSAAVGINVLQIFENSSPEKLVMGWVSIIVIVIFFFVTLRRGTVPALGAFVIAYVMARVIAIAFAFAIAIAIAYTSDFDIAREFAITYNLAGAVVGAYSIAYGLAFAVAFVVAGAFAVALGFTFAFTFAVAGAIAIAKAFSEATAIAIAIAIAIAVAMTLLCAYMAWQALKGNEQYALIRNIAIAFAARGGTSFRGADLTDADFRNARLKSTDLREAILTRTCWRGVEKLDRVRLGNSYLSNTQVRKLVTTGEGEGKNFNYLDLREINLSDTHLKNASFIATDLSRANLEKADLSEAKLVQTLFEGANLTKAILTGAYIQDWVISGTTKMSQVDCDYIFLKLPTTENPDRDRRPADTNTKFKQGEFDSLIGIVTEEKLKDLEAKYHAEKAKYHAKLKRLEENCQNCRLNLVDYIINLTYKEALLRKTKEIIEIYTEHNSNIFKLVELIANQSISIEAKAVSGDEIKGIKISDLTNSPISGVAGRDLSGQVSVAINSLPNSEDPNQPGIKELLEQLKNAIAQDTSLEEKQKEKLLKRVKSLADTANSPEDESLRDRAEDAIAFLKNNLPATAAAFTVGNTVLPVIAKILGF